MNNETLLNKLETIFKSEEWYQAKEGLNKIICDLKNEILCSKANTPSLKQRLKTCLSYCETMSKKRPIFAVSHYIEDYQVFTDSIFMVKLKDNDIMNDLPRDDQDYQFKTCAWRANQQEYPKVEGVLNYGYELKYEIDSNKLQQIIKANPTKDACITLKLDNDNSVNVSVETLKRALTFANITGKITFYMSNQTLRPFKLEKDNGTIAIITQVRSGTGLPTLPTYELN